MTLKVRVVGSGNAAQKHIAAFEQLPDMFQVFTDGRWADCDIVDICTPNGLHAEQTTRILNQGRHVIVEKPVAGALAGTDKLLELEKNSAGRVCPIAQYRYMPDLELDDGFNLIEIHQPRNNDYYAGWRGDPTMALGGCLTMFGIHVFDLLLQKAGAYRVVWAKCETIHHDIGVEDSAVVVIEMRDSSTSTVYIDTPLDCIPRFDINGRAMQTSVDLFTRQFEDIYTAITTDSPLPVTLTEARAAIELLTAVYQSAERGTSVMLPILPGNPYYQGWT